MNKVNSVIQVPEHLNRAKPEIIEIYKEWFLKREQLHNSQFRYITVQNPDNEEETIQIDLLQANPNVKRALVKAKVSKSEFDRIMTEWSKIQSAKSKIAVMKNKWDIPASRGGIKDIEPYMTNVIELFGSFKTVLEIKKILSEKYGYDISEGKLLEIKRKNIDKITKLKESWEESVDEYSVTHKKGQVERLVYLLSTQLDEYKKNNQYSVLRSKEIRAILEQIWSVVGGNKIVVDINQNINVTATINMNMSLRQISQKVSVNSFIIALVAVKYGIDPAKLMYKLENSYYKSFNGFIQAESKEEMFYPSGLINQYNWDEIKRKHDNNEIEAVEAKVIESLQPQNTQMKDRLLELMGNKITVLEKRRIRINTGKATIT